MYLGIDIGGTKTLMAHSDESGQLSEIHRMETPQRYDDFLSSLSQLAGSLGDISISAIGVAVPGKLNRRDGIAIACGNLEWKNVPIANDIQAALKAPVAIENDAKLAALSEANNVIDEYKKVLYLTISTGIGAGVVMDGKLVPALADCEVGSAMYVNEGKTERWEKFASGKAIKERFGVLARDIPPDSPHWTPISKNLAVGIFNILSLVQPDAVIIGGGVGSHLDLYHDKLVSDLNAMGNDLVPIPPVIKAQNAENAVLYGAIELARQHHGQTT